ncbi:MAG: hypothetical protein FWC34_00440 [Bacteroidetes bacterium]|nr:hypothetical protein [Bacteroidota bacterium]
MKKLILILIALPVLIACDNHIEQRTTVTEYEKERIRQVIENWDTNCFCDVPWSECEYFQLSDFRIVRTSFENWRFYETVKLFPVDAFNNIKERFTPKVYSVNLSNCYFANILLYFNSEFVFIWGTNI